MALAGYKFEWEAEAVEQTTQYGYTWDRVRDDLSRAVDVRKAMKGTDPTRIKLWWVPGMAAIGASMVNACADELESLFDVVRALAPACTAFVWREGVATKAKRQDVFTAMQTLPAGWFFDDDGPLAKRLACDFPNAPVEHVVRSVKTQQFAVIMDLRPVPDSDRAMFAILCGKMFGVSCMLYDTLDQFVQSEAIVKVLMDAHLADAPRPPTGYVYSREFGAGQVVCINGNEVTIDTERGRKTFVWTPPHDRVATPSETSRVSATLAHRTALLCRERWATDGFGLPTAAFVETCGVVAATWVEQGRDALPVSELLSCVRGLVGVA